MSKTIALRTELQRLFKTLITNVYHEEAPDTANNPYLVYELSEVFFNYGKTVFQLEINILDYGKSSSAIENLADAVQRKFNKHHYIDKNIQFTIYQGLRQTVKEEDKEIVRRRLLFEIQLHELKGD